MYSIHSNYFVFCHSLSIKSNFYHWQTTWSQLIWLPFATSISHIATCIVLDFMRNFHQFLIKFHRWHPTLEHNFFLIHAGNHTNSTNTPRTTNKSEKKHEVEKKFIGNWHYIRLVMNDKYRCIYWYILNYNLYTRLKKEVRKKKLN